VSIIWHRPNAARFDVAAAARRTLVGKPHCVAPATTPDSSRLECDRLLALALPRLALVLSLSLSGDIYVRRQ